jgi:mannose-6-phosphate isomerase
MMEERPTLFRLEPPIRKYDWGSHEFLARIRGAAFPTVDPEAELWIGAHDADPAVVPNEGPLNQLIAAEPDRFLGSLAKEKFGPHLPFLLKVLAIAKPLSLQVHPTIEQARAGFIEENDAGIAISSGDRTFVDDNHKPELVVAVSDFDALMGFREVQEIISFIKLLISRGAVRLSTRVLAPLQSSPDAAGLSGVLKSLLGQPDDLDFVAETVQAASQVAFGGGEYAASAGWFVKIAGFYPAHPDVIATLLLKLVHLTPGEAMYIAAGQVHSYLGGLVIEIMSSSDNVVRGGLTSKRVDVSAFLGMIDWTPGVIARLAGTVNGAVTTWTPPIDDFILTRISLGSALQGVQSLEVTAPMVLLALSHAAAVSRGEEAIKLEQGESMFAAPGSPISISGDATLWGGSCRVG